MKTNPFFHPGDIVKVTCLSPDGVSGLTVGQVFTIKKDHLNGYVTVKEPGYGKLDRWRLALISKRPLSMALEAAQ